MTEFPDNDRFRKLIFSYPGKALQFLYEFYYDSLVRISDNLLHDSALAEDVVQETFVAIWINHEHLGAQRGRSIHRYLIRVVRNKSMTVFKKRARSSKAGLQFIAARRGSSEGTPESGFIIEEIQLRIRNLIAEFPRREKQCFLLSRDEEMTNKQIAASLAISEKAVERSITSARKRIRKLIG